MVGCDGGQSERAGRRPRAGETFLTLRVAGVFLQLVIKLYSSICSSECVVRFYFTVILHDLVSLLLQTGLLCVC